MRDELEAPFLDDWLRDTEVTPPDPQAGARRVASQLPHAKQVGRWLPFVVFHGKAQTPTATDTADYQPTGIPATNGHSPTVIGRTQSMFSPVKAITAGALVFALGGVLLIAQPFDQQGGGVPGAATDADIVPPVEVTGRRTFEDACSETDYEGPFEDSGADAALFTCSYDTAWSFSDPRLEGTVNRIEERVTFELGDVSDVYIASNAISIENDGGTWHERPRTWLLPDGIATFDWLPQQVFVFEGSGDYEGLVAVLRLTGGQRGVTHGEDFRGFIIDARWMPPPPENASAK
jgi:hypothetical protein